MKKIDVTINDLAALNKAKADLSEQILKQPLIQDLLIKDGLDAQLINKFPYVFKDYIENRRLCVGCKGIYECKQLKQGYYKAIYTDDYLSLDLKQCQYAINAQTSIAYKDLIKVNHMPESYQGLSLDRLDVKEESVLYQQLMMKITKWLKNPDKQGFYLCGDVGVGKSYLMAAMTNYMAMQGYKVGFVSLSLLMQNFKTAIQNKESYNDEIDKLMKLDFVVFDDIGSESITPWLRDEILFPILNYRMEQHKWTWFTSNDSQKTLHERFRNCGPKDDIKAKRIMERIQVLAKEIIMEGHNRRR